MNGAISFTQPKLAGRGMSDNPRLQIIAGFHDEARQLRIAQQIPRHPGCQISSSCRNLLAETSMFRNTRNQWAVGGAYLSTRRLRSSSRT